MSTLDYRPGATREQLARIADLTRKMKSASARMNGFKGNDLAEWERVESEYEVARNTLIAAEIAAGPTRRELDRNYRANRGWAD